MSPGRNYPEKDVRAFQASLSRALTHDGQTVELTSGVYDAETVAAVKQLQEERGLREDGIAGKQVWVSLETGGTRWASRGRIEEVKPSDIRVADPSVVGKSQEAKRRAEDNTRMAAAELSAALESHDAGRLKKASEAYAQALAYQAAIAAAQARAQGATKSEVGQVVPKKSGTPPARTTAPPGRRGRLPRPSRRRLKIGSRRPPRQSWR